jgi:hypothetical protein
LCFEKVRVEEEEEEEEGCVGAGIGTVPEEARLR